MFVCNVSIGVINGLVDRPEKVSPILDLTQVLIHPRILFADWMVLDLL